MGGLCGPHCHCPFWLELFREVSASLYLKPEDTQSPGAENHSLASLQLSGTLPEATDDNNNNIAIIKEICIDRNCFPD